MKIIIGRTNYKIMNKKTLADFKRLPVGTELLTIRGASKFLGTWRKIAHKQTNAIKFEGGSWLEYPKANEFEWVENKITITSRTKTGEVWNILEYIIKSN